MSMVDPHFRSPLLMDSDQQYLGNSPGPDGRGRLHVKPVGGGINGIDWDYLKTTYPDSTTEVYSFYQGGSGGTLLATVTLTYLAADKRDLDTVTVVTA